MRVAKTKVLISFAVTAKLICAFVFAYADCWFSHKAAHITCCHEKNYVREIIPPTTPVRLIDRKWFSFFLSLGFAAVVVVVSKIIYCGND